MPKTVDPAFVSSAPDIDVSRALFEGLTDLDPASLEAIPAIAESWTDEDGHKTWTFRIREGAKWSNGASVTAADFVRSWKRVAELGDKAPHRDLLSNIVGFSKGAAASSADDVLNVDADAAASPFPAVSRTPSVTPAATPQIAPQTEVPELGAVAADDRTLRVLLVRADKDFPKLVAHPVFRPVAAKAANLDLAKNAQSIVTSGPFRIASAGGDGVTLDREQTYWDFASVKLDRVRFVPTPNGEKALEAYRSGEVDVVTNSPFSRAAVKLLEPYEDFRRTSFAALNFYELNTAKAPFNDRAVREALAIAIERESLTEGELGGSTRPAYGFTPFGAGGAKLLASDAARARELLDSAGYPNGDGFPTVRLLVNRNDTQQRIAKAVARMWKTNLNVETEIVVMEPADLEAAKAAGDYDAIRRGIVLPTPDEAANFASMFRANEPPANAHSPASNDRSEPVQSAGPSPSPVETGEPEPTLTEETALFALPGIPLYFPTSYSLVKPYVKGFDANSLDAPLLKRVEIDGNWKQSK